VLTVNTFLVTSSLAVNFANVTNMTIREQLKAVASTAR